MLGSSMAQSSVERELREAGSEFIASHQRTEDAIRAAVSAGMPAQEIARLSGLSSPTVDAFSRQLASASTPTDT